MRARETLRRNAQTLQESRLAHNTILLKRKWVQFRFAKESKGYLRPTKGTTETLLRVRVKVEERLRVSSD